MIIGNTAAVGCAIFIVSLLSKEYSFKRKLIINLKHRLFPTAPYRKLLKIVYIFTYGDLKKKLKSKIKKI